MDSDEEGVARSNWAWGAAPHAMGRDSEAVVAYEKALTIYDTLDDNSMLGGCTGVSPVRTIVSRPLANGSEEDEFTMTDPRLDPITVFGRYDNAHGSLAIATAFLPV